MVDPNPEDDKKPKPVELEDLANLPLSSAAQDAINKQKGSIGQETPSITATVTTDPTHQPEQTDLQPQALEADDLSQKLATISLHDAEDEENVTTVRDSAINLEPSNDETLNSSLESNDSSNINFIYPLRTEKLELQNFFNFPNKFENYQTKQPFQEFLEKGNYLISGSKPPDYKLKFNSAQPIIEQMRFDMYFTFRNYQIQNMQQEIQKNIDLLERLRLHPDENNELQEKKWLKIFKKRPEITNTFEARKAYFEKLKNLYKDVSIEVDPDEHNKGNNVAHIYKLDPVTKQKMQLVTIKTDHSGGKNNMSFTLDSSLKGKDLDNAIVLMMDQSTRKQESSKSNLLEISGYKNKPEIALRIYQLAILQGSRPTIHQDTLDAWQAKADDINNPERDKFAKAIKFHEKYKDIAAKNRINKLKKLLELQKQELKGINLKEYLSQQKSSQENPQSEATHSSVKKP